MSAEPVNRLVVVAPTYHYARQALRGLDPNEWQYVTRIEQLRGMERGIELLDLGWGEGLSVARQEMVHEALQVRGFASVTLDYVLSRASS